MSAPALMPWDLDYDAEWFIPLPDSAGGADAEAWVRSCAERYANQPGIGPDESAILRATAEALVSQAQPGVTQLWFAPRGLYSDLLVYVSVARSDSETVASTEALFDGATFSAAMDVTPLNSETLGAGYLLRRSTAVDADPQLVIEQWTVRLNNGTWSVLIDILGSSLPAFVLFEEQLPRLIAGIVLPTEELV